MSQIKAARAALIAALAGIDIPTLTYIPGTLSGEALIVLPGSPPVEPGDVFGTVKVNMTISVIMRAGTNEKVIDDLIDDVEDVITAVINSDFDFNEASPFYPYQNGNTPLVATDVTVSETIHL